MNLFGSKDRLYIALYRRKKPGTYHWSILRVSKEEGKFEASASGKSIGRCYHVKNILVKTENGVKEEWMYEAIDITTVKHRPDMVARVLVAKVKNQKRLEEVVEAVPVIQGDSNFRCNVWVKTALAALHTDGNALASSSLADVAKVQAACCEYANGKVAQGRYDAGNDMVNLPTWSMLDNIELAA